MIRSIAVGVATLMVSVGIAVAPNAAGADAKSPADSIKDAFGKVISLYSTYQNCMANRAVGQPCLAGDGANIREALRRLAEIQTQMAANQNELLARFDEVDTQLNQNRVEGYIRELRSVGLNTRLAVSAWNEYLGCLEAESTGAESCMEFRGGNELVKIPVAEGLEANKDMFLYYSDKLPTDVGTTVEAYAGAGGADRYRLADALWILNKQKLLLESKATGAAFRTSNYTPFVTPELASSVNQYLNFYSGLFSAFGTVMQVRTEMLRDEALQRQDSRAVRGFETQLRAIKYDIERRIESTRDDSVKGMEMTYGLTPLSRGEIMMANRPGSEGVTIFAGDSNLPGDRPMRSSDVDQLAQGLKNFGSVSSLMKAQPDAFPEDDWYEVTANVQNFTCKIKREFPVSFLATNTKVPLDGRGQDRGGPVERAVVRMKLLDARPSSNGASTDTYCKGKDSWGNDVLRIKGKQVMEANVLWPATYQWDIIDGYYVGGEGFGVFVKTVDGPTSRLVTEREGNRMVRWPDGFNPSMPPGY